MVSRGNQKCENCDAFLRENATQGFCRAKPPVPIMIGMGQPVISMGVEQQARPAIVSYFPQMMNGGWCREWAMRTEGNS